MMKLYVPISRPVKTTPESFPVVAFDDSCQKTSISQVLLSKASTSPRVRASIRCNTADMPAAPGGLNRRSIGLGTIISEITLRIVTSIMLAELGSRKSINVSPTAERLAPTRIKPAQLLCSLINESEFTLIIGRSAVPMIVRSFSATALNCPSLSQPRPPLLISLRCPSVAMMLLERIPCFLLLIVSRNKCCMLAAPFFSRGSQGTLWPRNVVLTALKDSRGDISTPWCRACGPFTSPAHASSATLSPRNHIKTAGCTDSREYALSRLRAIVSPAASSLFTRSLS
mmetsp:Transcript_18034/g.28803  ORF Transcript_18034/g.28803 Transcript_18034/m.28803 type:complete len:285 (+) Transcript_18034:1894-2748(+)